jgi:uncharacterized protein YijF (DUF1287 family)
VNIALFAPKLPLMIRAMRNWFFVAAFTVAFLRCGPDAAAQRSIFAERLSAAAIERTQHRVVYDGSYKRIDYPMGDVSLDRGVCSDVIVRSLRVLGVDLQQLVHEDMRVAFGAYPTHWGMTRPDPNIDHRRVPNLETFLTRKSARLAASDNPADYLPGDIVAWNLRGKNGGWLPHIGIVADHISPSGRPMIVHNIGAGPKLEDVLFDWPITGRYRVREETFGGSM